MKNNTKDTAVDYRDRYNSISDEVFELSDKIDKVDFLLFDLQSEYYSLLKPDAKMACDYGRGDDNSKAAFESYRWFAEYTKIITEINIAFDYVSEVKQRMSALLEQ